MCLLAGPPPNLRVQPNFWGASFRGGFGRGKRGRKWRPHITHSTPAEGSSPRAHEEPQERLRVTPRLLTAAEENALLPTAAARFSLTTTFLPPVTDPLASRGGFSHQQESTAA